MRKGVVIGGVLAALALLAMRFVPSLAWGGGHTVELRIHVRDSHNEPVRGARIAVFPTSWLLGKTHAQMGDLGPALETDERGEATMKALFPAGGGSGLFGKTGHFRVDRELLVEASGCRTISTPLANVVGGDRHPLSKRVLDVELVVSSNP